VSNQFTVLWSDESKADLNDIYDEYVYYSIEYAENLIDTILSREKQLATFPFSGSYQNLKRLDKKYRYLVEGNFKIVYHVLENEFIVYVNTIFDTRRNPSLLERNLR